MIGYYVHHVGQGHIHRAQAVQAELGNDVTVLSSLTRPVGWVGAWLSLPRDDDAAGTGVTDPDVTAGGVLHWAPRHHAGLRSRSAAIGSWIAAARPAAIVCDVSVEVALLARLFGVPVIVVALPGDRSDPPHQLAFAVSGAILAPWPDLGPDMCRGLAGHRDKVVHVGGISRFDGRVATEPAAHEAGTGGVAVLALRGAGGRSAALSRPHLPDGWTWKELGPSNWSPDPWADLCAADVVVAHCGLGALSDIAAARRPAVLLAEQRPHGEQLASARALAAAGVAMVIDEEPTDWVPVVRAAADRVQADWRIWSNGAGAVAAAAVIRAVAGTG